MSISAMSEAKLVREHPNQRSPNGLEKALGLDRLVERPKSSDDETPGPTGVPEGITRRLVRWIPTETITVYLAFIALYQPLKPVAEGEDLCTASGFTGRSAGVVVFAVATVLVVFLIHLARVRKTKEPFRWPAFEMVVGALAFVAWALALPDTPLQQICGYNEAIGGFIVLASTVVFGLVAEALGKQPDDTRSSTA